MAVVADHMSNGNSQLRETRFFVEPLDGTIDISSEIGIDALKNVLMSPSLFILKLERCNVGDGFRYYQRGMCKNLVVLSLVNCQVGGDVMELLGKYPMLQVLGMVDVKFGMTETLVFPSNSFPRLKFLVLDSLYNLKKLQVEETAMPKLTEIDIDNCKDLEEFPDGLRFISTLKQSDIMAIRKQFEDRVRGQDSASTSHIPSLSDDATTAGHTGIESSQDKDNDVKDSKDQE